jgi:2-keto-4-pentenoate hydratase/2-oxohepta-3-ene-1,7-dioic acid hydratase in catechol pathway
MMRLLTFSTKDNVQSRLGIWDSQGIIDVAEVAVKNQLTAPLTLHEAIEQNSEGIQSVVDLADNFVCESEIIYMPCVTQPEKIICIGLNYERHATESGLVPPPFPVVFSKFNNSLAAHQEVITLSEKSVQYDFEVELGVVIGRTVRNVSVADALNYVYGYCPANDLSVRDLQFSTSQWLLGKTLDKTMPVGPYLVTAVEVPDPQDITLSTWVNGERRQHSNTSDMIFSVAEIISYLSQYITLKPGDLISTGTPEGVIIGMEEPVWLAKGDEITVELQGLGRLSNRFV